MEKRRRLGKFRLTRQLIARRFIMFTAAAAIPANIFLPVVRKDGFETADTALVPERGYIVSFVVGAKTMHPKDWSAPAVREPGLIYTPWGIGALKPDKNSKSVWKYLKQAHHDLGTEANGINKASFVNFCY